MNNRMLTRLVVVLATILFVTPALVACSTTVALEPAADANNPLCAEVIVRLPESVGDQIKRTTNAQSTAAWGDPTTILLHCGVTPPGPTTDTCASVNGIDWVVDESDAPTYVMTTYGREPAVSVIINTAPESGATVSGTTVVSDLTLAVSMLPQVTACVGAADVFG